MPSHPDRVRKNSEQPAPCVCTHAYVAIECPTHGIGKIAMIGGTPRAVVFGDDGYQGAMSRKDD